MARQYKIGDTRVIESREVGDGITIRRRRETLYRNRTIRSDPAGAERPHRAGKHHGTPEDKSGAVQPKTRDGEQCKTAM